MEGDFGGGIEEEIGEKVENIVGVEEEDVVDGEVGRKKTGFWGRI